jgi:ferric-dicitrate binding protein FerR (iron transport regulator)
MSAELQPNDEQVEARAKRLLDMSAADLDPATVHRLQRARLTALEAKPARRLWMVLAGGLATAVAVVLTLTLWTKQPLPEHHAAQVVEDMDLVLSAENVELADDLEFYHWLADVDTTG